MNSAEAMNIVKQFRRLRKMQAMDAADDEAVNIDDAYMSSVVSLVSTRPETWCDMANLLQRFSRFWLPDCFDVDGYDRDSEFDYMFCGIVAASWHAGLRSLAENLGQDPVAGDWFEYLEDRDFFEAHKAEATDVGVAVLKLEKAFGDFVLAMSEDARRYNDLPE